ncbi:hypothetical protein FIBSPDRAFT_975600 [Athelia psychrophila]|uniref:Uncharacterized protein n=1 Tax=Athelia psychrophila TaxID=1759441 RepID=A0A166F7T5_9AGAM|nr:hypothetical protein FIBSPDRAFT_975600 [Fibularhizoctonia sp. CBS 109695]
MKIDKLLGPLHLGRAARVEARARARAAVKARARARAAAAAASVVETAVPDGALVKVPSSSSADWLLLLSELLERVLHGVRGSVTNTNLTKESTPLEQDNAYGKCEMGGGSQAEGFGSHRGQQLLKMERVSRQCGFVLGLIFTLLQPFPLETDRMFKSAGHEKQKQDDLPNRRGPRGWVSLPMFVHLEGEIPAFQAAQAAGELDEFWPNAHTRFRAKFIMPPLTEEEIAAGVTLEDKLAKERKRHSAKLLLDLQPKKQKKKKRLSYVQDYSKCYFSTKIKPVFSSRYNEHLREVEDGLVEKIKVVDFRNKLIREFWELEPEEVRDEIEKYREDHYLRGGLSEEDGGQDEDGDDGASDQDSENDDDGGNATASTSGGCRGKGKPEAPLDPVEAKAKEYYTNQVAAQTALAPILKELHEHTGYVGAVILAAPDGARGGELSTRIELTANKLIHRANRTPAGLGLALQKGPVEGESRDTFVGICVPYISKETDRIAVAPEACAAFRLPGVSVHINASGGPSHETSKEVSRAPSLAASRSRSNQPRALATTAPSRSPALSDRDGWQEENEKSDDGEKLPWEEDEKLSAADLASIKAEGSTYEMERRYNIIRNQCMLKEMQLETLAEDAIASGKKAIKGADNRSKNKPLRLPASPAQSTLPSLPSSPQVNASPNASPSQSPGRRAISPPFSPSPPPSPSLTWAPPPNPSADGAAQRPQPTTTGQKDTALDETRALSGASLADTHATKDMWPKWMLEIVRAMEHVGPSDSLLGQAMDAWIKFEALMEYPTSKAKKNLLSSQHRPHDIGKWIRAARKPTEMPDVSPYVYTFAKDWRGWWDSLQPQRDPANEPLQDVSEYSELRKAGPNGLFLLLLSLVWWGAAAADQGDEGMDVWRQAVTKFMVTVKFFNASMEEPQRKRARDSPENDSANKWVTTGPAERGRTQARGEAARGSRVTRGWGGARGRRGGGARREGMRVAMRGKPGEAAVGGVRPRKGEAQGQGRQEGSSARKGAVRGREWREGSQVHWLGDMGDEARRGWVGDWPAQMRMWWKTGCGWGVRVHVRAGWVCGLDEGGLVACGLGNLTNFVRVHGCVGVPWRRWLGWRVSKRETRFEPDQAHASSKTRLPCMRWQKGERGENALQQASALQNYQSSSSPCEPALNYSKASTNRTGPFCLWCLFVLGLEGAFTGVTRYNAKVGVFPPQASEPIWACLLRESQIRSDLHTAVGMIAPPLSLVSRIHVNYHTEEYERKEGGRGK